MFKGQKTVKEELENPIGRELDGIRLDTRLGEQDRERPIKQGRDGAQRMIEVRVAISPLVGLAFDAMS